MYYGELTIQPGAAADEFNTSVKLQSVKDGSTLVRSGQGIVYAGYSWRGRSKGNGNASTVDDLNKEAREVMWFSPDESQAEGRWFWGQYQEFGIDVKLRRASADPTLIGVDRTALKTGSQGNRVRLIGESFPAQIAPADLDFGSGVKVQRIVSHTPTEVVAEVDVAADAVSGKRDVGLARSVLPSAIAIYDRIDYIQVSPESAIAHLGSDVHPKGYQQFEAIAYQRGADGKPHTADDVDLGPVDVNWSVEEFYAVFGDDDKEFVGALNSDWIVHARASTARIPSANSAATTMATSGWWQPPRTRRTRKASRWSASHIWWFRCPCTFSSISPKLVSEKGRDSEEVTRRAS